MTVSSIQQTATCVSAALRHQNTSLNRSIMQTTHAVRRPFACYICDNHEDVSIPFKVRAVFFSEHSILHDDRSAEQWVMFHLVGLRIPGLQLYGTTAPKTALRVSSCSTFHFNVCSFSQPGRERIIHEDEERRV